MKKLSKIFEAMKQPKVAIIMRGLPGSGKSTLIKRIENIKGTAVHSTDAKFYNEEGKYEYVPEKVGQYHAENLEEFKGSLDRDELIVICDNTNLSEYEYEEYIKYAKDNGYDVWAVIFEPQDLNLHFDRNTHGVPKEILEKMVKIFSENKKTVGVDKEFTIKDVFKDADPIIKELKEFFRGENAN